jgi:hypothetical protein
MGRLGYVDPAPVCAEADTVARLTTIAAANANFGNNDPSMRAL